MTPQIVYKKIKQPRRDNMKYIAIGRYVRKFQNGKSLEICNMLSDGATGAFDIKSDSWWWHDKACNTGEWRDGTKMTNWECSNLISEVLWYEGRVFRAIGWLIMTLCFGGGEARKNGIFKLKENRDV